MSKLLFEKINEIEKLKKNNMVNKIIAKIILLKIKKSMIDISQKTTEVFGSLKDYK